MNRPTYSSINLTLTITHKDGVSPVTRKQEDTLAWIKSCLNCNTNHAEVEISMPSDGFLGWPDFMDPPAPGDEPDDGLLPQLDAWLAMDRKQLVSELLSQRSRIHYLGQKVEEAAADGAKARALESTVDSLTEMGFGSDEPINGGDCVESVDQLFQGLLKQFPDLKQDTE